MTQPSLNEDLRHLITLRNRLAEMDYADDAYDELEDDCNEAEDRFNEQHAALLDRVMQRLHQDHFPGQEVLLPSAYLASSYEESVVVEGTYDLPMDEGILVEWEPSGEAPRPAKLVLVPDPVRCMLFDGEGMQVLWSEEVPEEYPSPKTNL